MLSLPFGFILMPKREWNQQVSSRVLRSLHEFMVAVFHSPTGDLEIRQGMTEAKMYEVYARITGKKRFRKRKKTEVNK